MASSDELHGEALSASTAVTHYAVSLLVRQVPFHQAHMGGMLSSDQKACRETEVSTG